MTLSNNMPASEYLAIYSGRMKPHESAMSFEEWWSNYGENDSKFEKVARQAFWAGGVCAIHRLAEIKT